MAVASVAPAISGNEAGCGLAVLLFDLRYFKNAVHRDAVFCIDMPLRLDTDN